MGFQPGFQPMGAVLGTDRWYSIDTSNRSSDSFCCSMKSAALLLKSVEYDRCWRNTARPRAGSPCHSRRSGVPRVHGLEARATLSGDDLEPIEITYRLICRGFVHVDAHDKS